MKIYRKHLIKILSEMKICIILTMIIFLVSCEVRPGRKEYIEISKIPISNENEVLAKFSTYPVEKQIDIYLFSQCCVEGNSYPFLWYLATDGKNIIPYIVKRIVESNNPQDKANLMEVLDLIEMKCKCVAENADVLDILTRNEMQLVEENSDHMNGFRELYTEQLQRIKSSQQQK